MSDGTKRSLVVACFLLTVLIILASRITMSASFLKAALLLLNVVLPIIVVAVAIFGPLILGGLFRLIGLPLIDSEMGWGFKTLLGIFAALLIGAIWILAALPITSGLNWLVGLTSSALPFPAMETQPLWVGLIASLLFLLVYATVPEV